MMIKKALILVGSLTLFSGSASLAEAQVETVEIGIDGLCLAECLGRRTEFKTVQKKDASKESVLRFQGTRIREVQTPKSLNVYQLGWFLLGCTTCSGECNSAHQYGENQRFHGL